MEKHGTQRTRILTAIGLCGVGLVSAALATPPLGRTEASFSAIAAAQPGAALHRALGQRENGLDLRPASDLPATLAQDPAGGHVSKPPAPAMHHFGVEDRSGLAASGSVDDSFQVMSRAQAFARRVHREGLPLARLWGTKSALLSLGLNQRGKPGLWLIQKIR
jgi:hypothetical protein